jgi:hypothetical protein
MIKKYLMAVLLAASVLCAGTPSIIIDGGHFTSIGKETPSLVHDGISVSYLLDSGGKNSLELGGGFSFVSPVSSRDYFQKDFFNTVLKVFIGQAYDFTGESSAGLRVVSRAGFLVLNFGKFGFFYSIVPVFYVRVGFLSFGVNVGLEIEQFFGEKTLPVFYAGGEITYRF